MSDIYSAMLIGVICSGLFWISIALDRIAAAIREKKEGKS